MKITIISKFGECLDLALKLQDEGHEVAFHILTEGESDIGKNLITIKEKVGGLDADLIINDDVAMGGLSDRLRKAGKAVIGGSVMSDRLENDREFGHDIMMACGITVPHSEKFESFKEAYDYVKANKDKRYVFKPHGQKQRFLTHVSRDSEEMVAMMAHFEKVWPGDSVVFELQEFVEGLEIAVSGWFNGTQFAKPVLVNWEHKKLMEGEKGPNTGEMGTVMCYRTHNKLFSETLAKTEAFLKTTGYRGCIDLNCIVTKDAAYGLEWTSRFGYPTVLIQDELHRKGSWGSFLYKLALGATDTVPADTSKWDVGVAVCSLPWPLQNKSEMFKNRPVFMPENLDHIHFSDVWLDGKQYKQAGEAGYICICTGSDVNLRIAKEKAYKVVKTVYVPSGFWREDIADKVMEMLPQLKEWGWMK